MTVQNDEWQRFQGWLLFLSFVFTLWKCVDTERRKCLVLIFHVENYVRSALFFKKITSPVSSSRVETGLENTWNFLGCSDIPICFLAIPDMFIS